MADGHNDIKKYLRGELDAQAMHRLEKQALTDPFLAEALEGAETLDPKEFSADVNVLNRNIVKRTKRTGLIWTLRIAASLSLMAIISLVIYTWKDSTEENLALGKEKTEVAPKANPGEMPEAENKTGENPAADKAGPDGEASTSSTGLGVQAEKPAMLAADAASTTEGSKKEVGESPALEEVRGKSSVQDGLLSSGEIQTEELALDKIAHSQARPAGVQKIETEAMKRSANTGQQAKSAGSFKEALPNGGYEAFQDYLGQHVRYPRQAVDKKVEGLVKIRFLVKETGELTDFTAIQGIGSGCEEELIAAIRKTSWIPAHNENGDPVADSVTVSYQFILPH